jgi:putative aldouronate transport system substrate-binding protein
MRKKWLLPIISASLLAATAAGCSQAGKQEIATAGKPEDGKAAFSISFRSGNISYAENHPNINEEKWVKKLEELTNTDLDIRLMSHKEFDQKMIQMFAIHDIPDVVQASSGLTNPQLAGSVQAGVFLPLNDLLEKHGKNLLKKNTERSMGKRNGRQREYLCDTRVVIESVQKSDLDPYRFIRKNRPARAQNG